MASAAALFVTASLGAAALLKLSKLHKDARKHPSDILLIVDIGSSSARCSVFHIHPSHEITAGISHRAKRDLVREGLAHLEEIRQLVEECIDSCLSELRQEYPRGFQVIAVGFASFVMNIVGVNEHGCVITPVFTYARQTSETAEIAQSMRLSSEFADLHARVGTIAHSSYANVQLKAYYASPNTSHTPGMHWQTIVSCLLAKWRNVPHMPISTSEASWMGLLNVQENVWDAETVRRCGIDARHLPELADVNDFVLLADENYLARWPELRMTRFHYGIGDGAAANLGSQCTSASGKIAVTIGTSAAVRVILPASSTMVAIPKGLWCYRVDKDRLLLGGALTDGGSAIAWFRDVFRVSDIEFEALCREIQHDIMAKKPSTVEMLPFFGGERAPGWRDDATASLHGLTRATSRADILRSIFEGVCLRLRAILDRIAQVDTMYENAPLVASGGALEQSRLWRWILAQITHRQVMKLKLSAEITSFGVVQLLMNQLGRTWDIDDQMLEVDCLPDAEFVRMYDHVFEKHQNLYHRTWE